MRPVRPFLVLLSTFALGGCAVEVAGTAVPGTSVKVAVPRTSPKPLPFVPTIKNRTNDRNDGTTFEPCGEYADSEIRALDIDPSSISDAAMTDGANYRGCHWRGIDYAMSSGGTRYSQIVGMKMSLQQYKRYLGSVRWQSDRVVHGRLVAVAPENNYCFAVFASQDAIVVTSVSATKPSPGNTVECDKAVAFASLAITKAPE